MESRDKTWLHIGAGSFHRAHQAWYLHRLIESGDTRWRIALGNIRDDVSPVLAKLANQGNRYTLETVDSSGRRAYETIASIRKTIPWDTRLAALRAVGSDPVTGVISFTVTESGYALDNHNRLDKGNADIRSDLGGSLNTIYGTMAAILADRRAASGVPVTLLCCDNVRHKGSRFRAGLLEFLALRGENELAAWVEKNTTCPCCMVDRITPRPTPDIAERVLQQTGFADQVPIMSEAFIQWVVEDDFIAGRPALEKVGVEMVADVLPYEEAKIRILNATHAGAAWAGTLAGLEYIHEDMRSPSIVKMAYNYITDDVSPCLTPSPLDLAKYRDTVLDRFANPYIRDSNQRVAADGYSKIPAMVVPTLRERFASGARPVAAMALPALFFVYLQRWSEGRIPYTYQDGIMDTERVRKMFREVDPLAAYAHDSSLFAELATNEAFVRLLSEVVAELTAD